MLEVFEVEVEREDVTHLYYSEGVDVVIKNCVVKFLNNTEIMCEVIPSLFCRKKDSWKCVGHLVYDMTDPDGKYDNNTHIHRVRQSANKQLPG